MTLITNELLDKCRSRWLGISQDPLCVYMDREALEVYEQAKMKKANISHLDQTSLLIKDLVYGRKNKLFLRIQRTALSERDKCSALLAL